MDVTKLYVKIVKHLFVIFVLKLLRVIIIFVVAFMDIMVENVISSPMKINLFRVGGKVL